MKFNLPNTIYTTQDLAGVIDELRVYNKWQSHEAVKKRVKASKETLPAPALSPSAQQLIEISGADKKPGATEELIAALQKIYTEAPSVEITLAAVPTASLKTDMAKWCREHISPTVLISFQFNSTILGGMVVRYGSHIYDWSFRRRILSERGKFAEVLRHV